KDDPVTRHIPVMIVSAVEGDDLGMKHGALAQVMKTTRQSDLAETFAALTSFIERPVKNLLLVEDNEIQRNNTIELIGNGDVHTFAVATGREGLDLLKEQTFDCVVLDLGLPDMSGSKFIEEVRAAGFGSLPIVVHTAREMPKSEVEEVKRLARTVILKDVQSPERLFDETALFLHRVVSALPESKRKMLDQLHSSNDVLKGRKILIVDDDARNIFALTTMLENQEMEIVSATNGRQAIEMLQTETGISAVLMDIMMPEMDGYQTMKEIRKDPQFSSLPILALTAKAMKGDREKCLAAGASDYIAKPVNTGELLSLLRIWLYR
ncbi:MAG: hybrid sensor histidine kinase/response regulator, partial [Verrucomicrobia bacterium]|nr:hybrid sensor histidine kinase/response regulator [Verrucomicrobiota bacterium]